MGKLILATKWIKEAFEEGSRPSLKMVTQWVDNDEVPGRIIGNTTYVDADAYALGLSAKPTEHTRTGATLLN